MSNIIATETIQHAIHTIRGMRVMLDADLARLYGVATKDLNKAVKRNRSRFPADFLIQLTSEEAAALRFQIGTSKTARGGRRYRPYGFTEHGVAMLSSVLRSSRAIAMNIAIMRAFGNLRKVVAAHADVAKRLALLEAKLGKHSAEFGRHKSETMQALKVVFEALRGLAGLVDQPEPKREPIGFKTT